MTAINTSSLRIVLLLLMAASALPSLAQNSSLITATIVDSLSNEPIQFATVMLKKQSDNEFITGVTTDLDGKFKLRTSAPDVYLEISFIGYVTKKIGVDASTSPTIDLGQISLSQNAQTLQGVDVTAERSVLEFKLDKRVFNVGKDISSTGVGALEVLNNVPSVNVDIEGNVTLRGNGGVQILINGKPSVLAEDGNALGSITADMIDRVEVITNPSAKYEAGGTSGIINIVLKKEEKKGLNGSASINTGTPDNHSIGVSLNRRTEKFNFFTQFGVGYRSLPRYRESINKNKVTGFEIQSDGVEYRNEFFYNATLGTDYHINKYNILTLSGNYAFEKESQPSDTRFNSISPDGEKQKWDRSEETTADNPKWQYDLQYQKTFKDNEDHKLLFSTLGSFFGKELSSIFNNISIDGSEVASDQKTETYFYQADYTFKLDYTDPITDKITFETGAQYDINDVGNEYAVFNMRQDAWIPDTGFTNNFEYDQKVLGVYGTGSYETKKWGVKLGLRVENTDLKTLLTTTGQASHQQYTNLFPSLHGSYKFSDKWSVQAGYSRRIDRPRLWDLNPFFNIRNNFNIRQGNPELEPEFGDSYEFTTIYLMKKASINGSVYHLHTTNVQENITRFVDNVNITAPANIGVRDKTGLELNGKYSAAKWLVLNGDFNYGFFKRTGQYRDQNFDFSGDQASAKLTAKFKLPRKIDLETNGNWESGYKTVQGSVSGFAFLNLGLRKKLWDGKGIVNFSVRDVFASRIRKSIVDQTSFYAYDFSKRGRFVTLGFSYSFGKGEAMTYSGRRH